MTLNPPVNAVTAVNSGCPLSSSWDGSSDLKSRRSSPLSMTHGNYILSDSSCENGGVSQRGALYCKKETKKSIIGVFPVYSLAESYRAQHHARKGRLFCLIGLGNGLGIFILVEYMCSFLAINVVVYWLLLAIKDIFYRSMLECVYGNYANYHRNLKISYIVLLLMSLLTTRQGHDLRHVNRPHVLNCTRRLLQLYLAMGVTIFGYRVLAYGTE